MRRAFLLTATALGTMLCLVGSTGLFAALSDTARTGTNSVTSEGLASSADIKLAMWNNFNQTCGTFSDDLSTPIFTITDVSPGDVSYAYVCIATFGSQDPTSLNVLTDELTDLDQGCTGDEADSGDTTCGGGGQGELSSVLTSLFRQVPCAGGQVITNSDQLTLFENSTIPSALPLPTAGNPVCFEVQVRYPGSASATDIQQAQSDTTSWRFKFVAQT